MEGENCQQELLFRKDGPLDGASNANLDCCDNYDDLYDELSADDKELVRQKSMNLCQLIIKSFLFCFQFGGRGQSYGFSW